MAVIDITCPDCGEDISMPARALLATLDLARFCEPFGRLSWVCVSCERFITAEIEVADLLRVVSAGVLLVDDDFGASSVESGDEPAEHARGGAPFTLHDVEVLHDLLDTETWFQRLAEPSDGSS